MQDKYLVIVGDPDTGSWSVAVNSPQKKQAEDFVTEMIESGDPSPRITIYTGDFLQV